MCGSDVCVLLATGRGAGVRVVFVSDHFSTPDEPGVLRTWQLARHLGGEGDDVVVIAPRFYRSFASPGSPPERGPLPRGLTVVRLPPGPTGAGSFSRVLEYLQHLMLTAVETWRAGPCDVVVSGLTPSVLGLGPYLVARIRATPFVVDERDLALDAAACLRLMPAPLLGLARVFERQLHCRADHVVVVSEGIRRMLVQRGVGPERVTVVPNGYDPLPPEDGVSRDELRRRLGWNGHTVLLYAGGVGPSHDLGVALEAMVELVGEDVVLAIVGDGRDKDELVRRADHLGVAVRFLPPSPKRGVADLCRAADICLLPLHGHAYWSCSLPAKLFDYLGAGRPVVVAAPEGDACGLVREAGAGLVVAPGDARRLATAVTSLARDPGARAAMGASGRSFVAQHYHRDRFSARFRRVLLDVTGQAQLDAPRHDEELDRIRAVYRRYDGDPTEQAKRDQTRPGLRVLVDHRWRVMEDSVRALPLPKHPRILDIGCGTGEFLLRAAKVLTPRRPALHGVDILPDRIAAAKALLPDAHLEVCSGDQLPYEDGYFDLVAVSTLFSSIVDEALATAVAREMLRVLHRSGTLMCYDVRYPNPCNRNTRPVTRRHLRRLFPEAQIHARSLTLLPPLARRLGPVAPRLYRPLHAVPVLRSHYLAIVTHPTDGSRAAPATERHA